MANKKKDTIKAIVFDLDDTLYPQVSFKRSGFKAVSSWLAEKHALDSSTVLSNLEAILEQFGPSYPNMFDRLAERLDLKPTLVSDMVQVFIDHEPEIQCYEGVASLMKRLRSRHRLGILTDGRLPVQRRKIKALGLENRVDAILCSDSLGLEKPSGQLYAWFEKRFKAKGHELIYVGDNSSKDFIGANKRGWITVQVITGEGRNESLSPDYHANYSLSSVVDIDKYLMKHQVFKTHAV